MELVRENIALLDRAVFNNIRIHDLYNMDELARRGMLTINEKSQIKYITAAGQEFSTLSIKGDELIDSMVAGSKLLGNSRNDYCMLETSIKDDSVGNLSCYTVQQYTEYLKQICDRLICQYGIDADFSRIGLKQLEINRTFKLDGAFEDYYRALEVIMHNLPSDFKGQMDFKNGERQTETYYAKTGSKRSKRHMVFKIYNKSKSVRKYIILDDDYMRIEITLVGAEKIKSALGTNRFYALTDETINNYFNRQMEKLIIKPLQKWKVTRDKHLKQLMREQMIENERYWQVNTLRALQNEEIEQRCPVILDISELNACVPAVIKDRQKRSRVKSTFIKQARKHESVFCKNDHEKLDEIIRKLQCQR